MVGEVFLQQRHQSVRQNRMYFAVALGLMLSKVVLPQFLARIGLQPVFRPLRQLDFVQRQNRLLEQVCALFS